MPQHDEEVTIAASSGAATSTILTPPASRFAPGSIIAGRYRLVALLGRGGMGEVYRADDLTLDQAVALKFLPQSVAADEAQLAQFHNELRVARQVSHKNVCRMYDLGEADGYRFLTMEYVDGEDLASLLRRIGRIPETKAVEIARQLCAGLAAAHERKVLHRDLKPANVMLDGEGNVRITDFGLATAGADTSATLAGTPQYMAPEQLKGQSATVRSDVYALGLILFEIFTGRRAHDAKTIGELKAMHETGSVTTPSSVVRDIDPAVERVILRCLDRDPEKRPASALAVAAGLPGADPLAAALAAGETPSPEMLAAAGETEALGVARAVAAVAFVLVGLVVVAMLSPRISVAGRVPSDKPPAVLADRAQQILTSFGYTEPVADSAWSLSTHQAFLRWIAASDQRPNRWDRLNAGTPGALLYWQRTSPRLLVTQRSEAQVSSNDPPMTVSGMTLMILDTRGRMIEFQAVAPQFEAEPAAAQPPRWEAVFDAAGLDMSTFASVAPQWAPRDFADTRAAWEGPLTGQPEYRVRIEAAAYRGRPVSTLVLGPWSRPTRMAPLPRSTSQTVLLGIISVFIAGLVAAALLIARYNIRARRADQRSAGRLAIAVTVGYAASWAVSAHHVPDVQQEIDSFMRYSGGVLATAAIFWVVYLALEPYVRRFWPDGILGWTRLMSGYVRDPRVGRDVLLGCAVAVGLALIEAAYTSLPARFGYPAPMPLFGLDVVALTGPGATVSTLVDQMVGGLYPAMFAVLGYVLLRLALRGTALAIAAAVLILGLFQAGQVIASTTAWWIAALFQACLIATVVVLVVRYGLLVSATTLAVGSAVRAIPLTLSLGHWTATASNLTIAVVVGLTLFGFYASRAGQPLFGKIEL